MADSTSQQSKVGQEVLAQRKGSLGLALLAGFVLIVAGPFLAMFADVVFLDTRGHEVGPGESPMSPAGRVALAFLLPAGALAGGYCAAAIANREQFFVALMLAAGSGGMTTALVFAEPYAFATQIIVVAVSIGAALVGVWLQVRRKSNKKIQATQ